MTRIKCDIYIIHTKLEKKNAKPIYCKHRNKDGFCSLKEIQMDECDSGWQATCENMEVRQ